MQLSAKALLKPFSGPTMVTDEDNSEIAVSSDDDDGLPALEDLEGDDEDDEDYHNDDEGDNNEDNDAEDVLETLGAEEREALLKSKAVI